jgi:hypothetical protein
LLPVVHPRLATPDTAANGITLIDCQDPDAQLRRSTFVVTLVGHIAYARSSA